ncbi:RNA methyltransferase, RsmD family [secondary endosymbiont of Heteropsylla cubana]|uniref:Ribosomal RNA small subunit methyltransferase D n=1 Tax=secondary endosymbiont of Heteropsylla cubana TaxID=134287 RepID=J3YSU8_9ENTR|nr:16S rRNA (guanine(966)-N(2))-methyltransferase RsmD [secondary endosymbiont of Heteropsylla cubana]AFP85383.1 RNA methyltransferase, RsmD family [secondary endosymbiont of Heteropsylla cubana]
MFYFNNKIRIIGGCWRGRKILVSDIPTVRPTPSRVRETVFNWLSPVIKDARCLDCFAGSGALGFEAMSRSAGRVTLLEKNSRISALISHNLQKLQGNKAEVITTDALFWLAQPGIVFDIVFIDPPFRSKMINPTLDILEKYGRLSKHAWIYIETEIENSSLIVPSNWQLHRRKIAGKVLYRLYVRNDYRKLKQVIPMYLK